MENSQTISNEPLFGRKNFKKFAVIFLIFLGFSVYFAKNEIDRVRGKNQFLTQNEIKTIGVVPEFSLIDSNGFNFSSSQMKGSVWVVNFMFTTCPTICPMLSSRMARIQNKFMNQKNVRLMSITVDPEVDTPKVLHSYKKKYLAVEEKWKWLTGNEKNIHNLIQKGFYLPSEARGENEAEMYLPTHSDRMVLVDQEGNIRQIYQSSDPKELGKLVKDIKTLTGA